MPDISLPQPAPSGSKRGAGVIAHISSAVTLSPLPMLSAYTASKAAIEACSETLAIEVEPFDVRVRLVIPGLGPETSFRATARERSKNGIPDAYAAWAKQALSVPRKHGTEFTTASNVAEAVWHAVTDRSAPIRIPAGVDAVPLALRECKRQAD